MIMRPMMLPSIGFAPWQSQITPSGYQLMLTPPSQGDGVLTIPQVNAPYTQMLCPQKFLPTTISPPPPPPTPSVLPFVPPIPPLSPPNSTNDPPHYKPQN